MGDGGGGGVCVHSVPFQICLLTVQGMIYRVWFVFRLLFLLFVRFLLIKTKKSRLFVFHCLGDDKVLSRFSSVLFCF